MCSRAGCNGISKAGKLKVQSSNHFSETTLICMVLVCNFHLAETECEHIAGQNRTGRDEEENKNHEI